MVAPSYCQYAQGQCDQAFSQPYPIKGFFIYPSQPPHLAHTVNDAVRQPQTHSSLTDWKSWESLQMGGQIILCEICKAIRRADLVIANITNLNFNVLFEMRYALGLAKPLLPVRDTSYEADKDVFEALGIFDTLGYEDFHNSNEPLSLVRKSSNRAALALPVPQLDKRRPIFYLRSIVDSDGSVKLFSALKKSPFRFRTFDAREVPRLSLHEANRQVHSSVALVAHLIDPARSGARVHNARCAFICGLALAAGKQVLAVQEGAGYPQPIDYRDMILPYSDPRILPRFVHRLIQGVVDTLSSITVEREPATTRLLEQVDLGDIAAENEIEALSRYFVRTPQFQQALQGHARLVVGRKGSGKTTL